MNIKIDVREAELLKKCQANIEMLANFKDLKIIPQQLPLGDIIINNGEKDLIIIERKTLGDLAASIRDGRYEEQSYRLKNLWHHNHNIIYLIEGDFLRFNAFKDRVDKLTLYSAITSINYFKGFSVWRTMSMDETALMICNLAYKLNKEKDKQPFYSNDLSVSSKTATANVEVEVEGGAENSGVSLDKEYCAVSKKVKKDNITSENIGEIMLSQIPGISTASALAILAQFKTLPSLIKAIDADETCLNNICTTDANGKSRKISKTAISTIIKFLKA
jgi:ERCC4-type nuclease